MVAAIPDRWLQYKACGRVIEGTRIICFKVPLKRTVQIKHVDKNNVWDIKHLLKNIPHLGAVVDLTNTARYYDPKQFKEVGILHMKIMMPGRIIPPEEKVNQFMNAVDTFLAKDDGRLLGVHCTHGLNRTGYMVCRYLRDRLGFTASDAIRHFELARGYQIERDNYVADLLGKNIPPPDIGCETIIKPIERKQRRDNNKNKCGKVKIDDQNSEILQSKHKFKPENENSKIKKRKFKKNHCKNSAMERSDSSYDFKYDY